jgi:hypothetical protein
MGYIAEQIHRAAAQGGGVGLSPLDTLEAIRRRINAGQYGTRLDFQSESTTRTAGRLFANL